ncbi:type II secretion system protein [Simiduia litorea]|uniref:PulJ/GspJ family protein n=1 Tax=Simiduia litorea TaxID=1435348 RepID=UPI0036F2D276
MSRGFTLIELITVLVVFSIVAAMGSSYVVTSITAYNQAAERNKLVSRSRAVVERITRQIRIALPYSIRISASGQCLEFMQLSGGANYQAILPDSNNGAPAITAIATAPFSLSLGAAASVAVGAMADVEVYSTSASASRASIASVNGNPITQINLTSPHRFIRNSINSRVYVLDNPERFCVTSNQLWHYSNYGLNTGVLSDANPGGNSALMSDDVFSGSPTFSLSPATESRNTIVDIEFSMTRGDETLRVSHQVQIRNVP